MAVKRKASADKKKKLTPEVKKEEQEFIEKGGGVTKKNQKPKKSGKKNVRLILHSDIIDQIDTYLESLPEVDKISRHQWIVNTIRKELKRLKVK